MEVIIEEGICTLCGRRTKVALLECWEDQDRGIVEMNVTLCATCLTHILQRMEGSWRNKDGKEGGGMFTEEDLGEHVIRQLNHSIQHLQNAMERIAHGEAGFCLEEIH